MSFHAMLTRVLVFDPNPVLAGSVGRGLELCGGFATRACSDDLRASLLAFRPHIVVLDPAHLPGPPEACRAEVMALLPHCEVLAYVDVGDRAAAARCLAAGFAGAVSQGRSIEVLVEALTAVRTGGVYVDDDLAPLAGRGAQDGRCASGLSDRERFVLEQVARGFSNKEIAGRLGLSSKTVETHRARASGKLGLRRKSEIVAFALRNDWLAGHP